jgi:hypothetical protein
LLLLVTRRADSKAYMYVAVEHDVDLVFQHQRLVGNPHAVQDLVGAPAVTGAARL